MSQCAPRGSISLPSHERERDRCAIPHVGFSRSLSRRDFAPGSVAGPHVPKTVVVQLPCGAVSSTQYVSRSSKIFKLHAWTLLGMGLEDRDSARAASFLAQSLRSSTSLVYDRKWDIFCTWCTERQIDPVSFPIGDLGDFLLFL